MPVWTLGRSGRIDRIADELIQIERVLAVQRIGARLVSVDESQAERPRGVRFSVA